MWRSGVTLPVSESTSTTETCAPKGNVGPGGTKSFCAASTVPARCGDLGQLGPAERARRHPDDADPSVAVQLDVRGIGLEQLRRELEALRRTRSSPPLRPPRRRSGATASRRSHRRGYLGGVGLDEPDLLDRNAEAVRDDHRERGGMTLATRRGADPHRRRAVGMHLDRAELAARARRR